MRQLQPVLWTKGVFLTPQHLQTQDRFFESLLQFHIENLTFCPWGFRRLQVNHEALAGGSFALSAASGIFPDGLLFEFPESDPVPAPKALEGCWEPDQQDLDLYLAIPHFQERGVNVSVSGRDLNTRYRAAVIPLRDENNGLAEKPVQVACKNLRLLAQGDSLEGMSALRVARVRRTAAGEYQLDPRFVPPVIDIEANDYLQSIARRLVEILAARSSALAGTRRQKNLSLAEFSATDIASFWLLYTINIHFPEIRHLFETRRGHPRDLYAAMLSLAASLTTFSDTVHPRDLPVYDHENLSACFTELDEKLRLLLETVVPTNCVSLPLRLVQPSIYAASLAEDRYLNRTQFFLAIRAEMNQADLILKTPLLVKISSADQLEHLIRQALPGVELTHSPKPPGAIPVKLNYQYFSLTRSGPAWDSIQRARNLAAYVPADFPDPQLELVILLPHT